MRFFAQCNAQNWHICMKTTLWKNVGGKTGEYLRQNWKSWALRRCSAKISGEDSGFAGACPWPPLGYGKWNKTNADRRKHCISGLTKQLLKQILSLLLSCYIVLPVGPTIFIFNYLILLKPYKLQSFIDSSEHWRQATIHQNRVRPPRISASSTSSNQITVHSTFQARMRSGLWHGDIFYFLVL